MRRIGERVITWSVRDTQRALRNAKGFKAKEQQPNHDISGYWRIGWQVDKHLEA